MVMGYRHDVASISADTEKEGAGSSWRRGSFDIAVPAIANDVWPAAKFPTFKGSGGLLLTEVSRRSERTEDGKANQGASGGGRVPCFPTPLPFDDLLPCRDAVSIFNNSKHNRTRNYDDQLQSQTY